VQLPLLRVPSEHLILCSDYFHKLTDYSISVLAGLPVYLVRPIQSVLNAAARLTYHLRRSDHITDVFVCLHWLRVLERVQYKIAVLVYEVLHDMGGARNLKLVENGGWQVPGHRWQFFCVCAGQMSTLFSCCVHQKTYSGLQGQWP